MTTHKIAVAETVEALQVGLKEIGWTGPVRVEDESDTESSITVGALGVSIFVYEDGTPMYMTQVESHYPGDREEPPSSDWEADKTFKRLDSAVTRLFELVVRDRIANTLEAHFMAKEFEAEAAMLAAHDRAIEENA
jgi:hypothetical protein